MMFRSCRTSVSNIFWNILLFRLILMAIFTFTIYGLFVFNLSIFCSCCGPYIPAKLFRQHQYPRTAISTYAMIDIRSRRKVASKYVSTRSPEHHSRHAFAARWLHHTYLFIFISSCLVGPYRDRWYGGLGNWGLGFQFSCKGMRNVFKE